MNKLCLFCKHFEYESGSPAYSEYTPGMYEEMEEKSENASSYVSRR